MIQTADIVTDSVGQTGKRISTLVINHWRGIHPELLRHRLMSFSVASSRAIPYSVQSKQVSEDPMLPVFWSKHHTGMQGKEVFEENSNDYINIKEIWKICKDRTVQITERLTELGLSKQLTNRLLEPWISTRAVITATEWDNFFELRHPWHYEDAHYQGHDFEKVVWDDKVNLEFPAEYNIQDLTIKIKKALDESEPTKLNDGDWHLPFIDEETRNSCQDIDTLCKISAARCARTSYGKNCGKTIEDEIKLAELLIKEKHFSPFEHQAQALPHIFNQCHAHELPLNEQLPLGVELRISDHHDWISTRFPKRKVEVWSGNFKEWIQYRKTLELKL